MEQRTDGRIPLLIICGPTASGKTAVGAELARILGGEVISADSMQIYRGMEIASAAPEESEMKGVPHHLIGILDPGEPFSAAEYKAAAEKKIAEITGRNRLPVIVGGTGLYINSLVDNVDFGFSETDGSVRRELEALAAEKGNSYMMQLLRECDPAAAERLHENNIVRVIRALELYRVTGRTFDENMKLSRRNASPYCLCMIGLNFAERSVLYERIDRRVGIMAEKGLADEAKRLYVSGDMKTSAQAIGYKELIPYLEGRSELGPCLDEIRKASRHYAKRQLTWFRRDARISWINQAENEQFDKIIENCLNVIAKSEIMCYNKK